MDIKDLEIIVATEINLITLKMYRLRKAFWHNHEIDSILLADLRDNLIEAIKWHSGAAADDGMVDITLKLDAGEFLRLALTTDLAAEPKNHVAPAGADEPLSMKEPEADQRQPAGQPDTPKSPATEQDAPETVTEARTTSRPAEASPIGGDDVDAGSAIKPKKKNKPPKKTASEKPIDQPFFDLLHAWLKTEKLSYCEAARRAGVSDPTIGSLATGTTMRPNQATKEKILAAIRKDKKKSAKKPVDEHAQFIKQHLKSWLDSNGLDANSATTELSVSKNLLQDILEGHMPVNNVIHQLAQHVPGIKARYAWLMRGASQAHRTNGHGTGL